MEGKTTVEQRARGADDRGEVERARCKKCGIDLASAEKFYEMTPLKSKPYYMCEGCYSEQCPRCGGEMEQDDPGCDEPALNDWWLTCEKCGVHIDVTRREHGIISIWYEQHKRDFPPRRRSYRRKF